MKGLGEPHSPSVRSSPACEVHLGGRQEVDALSQLLEIYLVLQHGAVGTVDSQCATKLTLKIKIGLKHFTD